MITLKLLCYLARGTFLVLEMSIFCAAGWVSAPALHPHLKGFSQMEGLEEGVEQSIHGGGNKQDESRWNIFGFMGNTEGGRGA